LTATELAEDATVSRQAIVKHLQLLANAGLAVASRDGREVRYAPPRTPRITLRLAERPASAWDRRLAALEKNVRDDRTSSRHHHGNAERRPTASDCENQGDLGPWRWWIGENCGGDLPLALIFLDLRVLRTRFGPSTNDSGNSVRTFSPKGSEITRDWLVIDAEGLVLGRIATVAASLLRGKHRVYFAPHIDCGDNVIIVNAEQGSPDGQQGRPRSSPTTTRVTRADCARRPGRRCWTRTPSSWSSTP